MLQREWRAFWWRRDLLSLIFWMILSLKIHVRLKRKWKNCWSYHKMKLEPKFLRNYAINHLFSYISLITILVKCVTFCMVNPDIHHILHWNFPEEIDIWYCPLQYTYHFVYHCFKDIFFTKKWKTQNIFNFSDNASSCFFIILWNLWSLYIFHIKS